MSHRNQSERVHRWERVELLEQFKCYESGRCVVRPPRIELGLRVPETLVISLSLRARGNFLASGVMSVNVRL